MSTTQNNETSSTLPITPPSVPDGQSELPATLPDYPTPGSTDPGPSGGSTGS